MARTKKMKVFVWENVLSDYTKGMMVAIAPTVEEAREALLAKHPHLPSYELDQEPQELDLSEVAVFVCWGGA